MTLPAWEIPKGSDFYAPQPIVVKVGGVAVDLTDTDWKIKVQAKKAEQLDTVAFTPTWDTDTGLLAAGEVWLIVPRAISEAHDGTHYVDLRVTNDTLPKVKRKHSRQWSITFVDSITGGADA